MPLKNFNVETDTSPAENYGNFQQTPGPSPVVNNAYAPAPAEQHHPAARGFGQAFGLHPLPAILTLAVDSMLFGGTIVTGGAIWPLALVVAVVLGFITYRAQMHFYGDTSEAAMLKGVSVALLTGIPSSLPGFLTIPSAFVGLVNTLRKK